MAVTKEQIFSAADELAASGQRPTLEAIRKITGGSYTTISPALNEWKARQVTAAAPLREPAPQAVADRLAELGSDLWTIALDLANARLAAEREGLEKARAELEADRNEATELADKLAGDVEALQSRLASIEAAEAAARGEADELRGQLAAAQEQAHTAEARAQEIERRAGELRTELDRAHRDADQARAQLDQVRGELAKVQARADADQEAHQEQRKQAAAEAHRMAERLTAAQAERDQAMKAAAQAREEAARLAGQLDTLKEQSAALLARITPLAAEAKPTRKKPGTGE
ncbi:KfrA [Salmonella enterica subsp. enterica serovar Schwarzengrund]|nr:KfrA [Salmonella enterica]EGR8242033.1 KfrA [Salmonella enterica subsp. enterica serovar Schwarzengrund]